MCDDPSAIDDSRARLIKDIRQSVENIREKVGRGELPQEDLDLAEYMTNPNASFPVRGMTITEFMRSMQRDFMSNYKK